MTNPEVFTAEYVADCPKCGSDDIGVFRLVETSGLEWYSLECGKCHHTKKLQPSFEEAVMEWNRRQS